MDIDKSQFFQVFYEETGEHLGNMEQLLLNLDLETPDSEDLNAIFRAVHSIKGGAGTFGFDKLTTVAHAFETVLDQVRKDEIHPTAEMVDLFLEGGDILKEILSCYQEEQEIDLTASTQIIKQFKAISDGVGQDKTEAATETKIEEKAEEEEDVGFGFFDDDFEAVDGSDTAEPAKAPEAEKPAEVEEDLGFGFFDDDFEPVAESETAEPEKAPVAVAAPAPKVEAVKTASTPVEKPKVAKPKAAKKQKPAAEASSIRIGVDKVDALFNQVGEIVITQAMLAQTASHLDPHIFEKLESGLSALERNTRNLQESVMAIRMVPIRMVFSRFPRLVRDMKKVFGKELELIMIGEETEIDKGFIEKLSDPLTHLLRNSFDHGIESPEARKAAGKDITGTIILRASHQGGNVVIEVSDDGAGLNRERILSKAKDQGIPVPEGISDAEIWNLIFAPGFSTAKVVSDISGRGVGMDVVKKNVQSMGGTVEITSEAGKGSRFKISLPLTLAIIEGMVVRVGEETYILPLTSIIESIRPKASEVKTVMERGELVNMRGEFLPVVRLYELFGVGSGVTDLTEGVLTVIESEGTRVAVLVDELVGQQQVVIKSMEKNYQKVQGIAGATILGDGHVAFIIDVRGIFSYSRKSEGVLVG